MKVKHIAFAICGLVAFLVMQSCTKTIRPEADETPEWYLKPPTSMDALYGVGEATGKDMGLTRLSADSRAREEIARQISVKVASLFEESQRSVGGDIKTDVVVRASRQTVSQDLTQVEIEKREVKQKDGGFVVYSLAVMSYAKVKEIAERVFEAENVKSQIKDHEDLQRRLDELGSQK